MKVWLAICLIITSTFVWANDHTAAAPRSAISVKGEVLEIKEVESYTYLRLKTKDGETWAAVPKAQVKKGADVTITNASLMNDFESKTLKMTFPTILFGALGGAEGAAPAPRVIGSDFMPAANGNANPHAAIKQADTAADIKVAKASGKNAYTVAEIIGKSDALKDKPVLLSAKVVKFNAEIMGKNWLHLRDGSGSATENNNDILVTSNRNANIGDIVTVKGTVRTNQDFGSGYSYKVLIDEVTKK